MDLSTVKKIVIPEGEVVQIYRTTVSPTVGIEYIYGELAHNSSIKFDGTKYIDIKAVLDEFGLYDEEIIHMDFSITFNEIQPGTPFRPFGYFNNLNDRCDWYGSSKYNSGIYVDTNVQNYIGINTTESKHIGIDSEGITYGAYKVTGDALSKVKNMYIGTVNWQGSPKNQPAAFEISSWITIRFNNGKHYIFIRNGNNNYFYVQHADFTQGEEAVHTFKHLPYKWI